MVARMPRYAPAVSGIRSTPRIPASGQNGSSRHVPASPDTSSEGKFEQSSGLLTAGSGFESLAAHVFAGLWPALMMPETGLRTVSGPQAGPLFSPQSPQPRSARLDRP